VVGPTTAATYRIQVIHSDRQAWEDELREAVTQEVTDLGLHKSVNVTVEPTAPTDDPGVVAFLGSATGANDATCVAALGKALADGHTVVPVVSDLAAFSDEVPDALRRINGRAWQGSAPAKRLARGLLEELGVEERQRSVFISHRRHDGLYAAEQLYDHLGHHGFLPFIDRFGIRAAADVPDAIADALEERAFLLLVETPQAHESEWVFLEVDYALTHYMGIHIVRWPGDVRDVPGSSGLPRQTLSPSDLVTQKGYDAISDEALDVVLCEVEAVHARALVRRRRQLLRNVEDAAEAGGLQCTPLPDWRFLVEGATTQDVVGVTGRLPTVEDLYGLDAARLEVAGVAPNAEAVLVHGARRLREERRRVLEWATDTRPVTLVPENAIGGYW
jgi:hypothetical protein